MLAHPRRTGSPSIGILLIIALVISMILFSKINSELQQTVMEEPIPAAKIMDAETEHRIVKMQVQIDEVKHQVQQLHLIYGTDLPNCETLQNQTLYQRCHDLRKLQYDRAQDQGFPSYP